MHQNWPLNVIIILQAICQFWRIKIHSNIFKSYWEEGGIVICKGIIQEPRRPVLKSLPFHKKNQYIEPRLSLF